ncbi:MAG: choice-of-anchor Q domain-containing protein [Pseudomonadota bacterium]
MRLKPRQFAYWLIVGTCLLAASTPTVGQIVATIRSVEVTTLSDNFSPPGCSLREAIESLDLNVSRSGCSLVRVPGAGADQIVFDAAILPGEIRLNGRLIVRSSMFIRGPGRDQLSISGQNADAIIAANVDLASAGLIVHGLTLTEGMANEGGAIDGTIIQLSDVRVTNCSARIGGGAVSASRVTISDSEFVGNRVTSAFAAGGAISAGSASIRTSSFVENESSTFGGAVASRGELSISDSTFLGNRAATGGAIAFFGTDGVAERSRFIDNDGEAAVAFQQGTSSSATSLLIFDQSVIVDELANPFGTSLFGQLNDAGDTTLALENSTVFSRRTIRAESRLVLTHATIRMIGSDAPPAIILPAGSSARFSSAILASDNPVSCQNGGASVTGFSNLYQHTDCGTESEFFSLFGDPMLGPLRDNGGPTESMRPLPGSPVIDQAGGFPVEVDQRGFPRIEGERDIGAIEVGARTIFSDGFEP